MSNTDHIRRVVQGDELSAERDAQILEAIDRKWSGAGSVTDFKGTALSSPFKRRICRFEMVDELLLPQNGSGTADAYFLSWAEGALGNLTGIEDKTIKVVDTMRCHSKMENPAHPDTGAMDVGAYGLAWIPDDPLVHSPYNAHWEILWMQTPGDFIGIILSGESLTHYNSSPPSDGDSCWVAVFDPWPFPSIGHRTFGGFDPFGINWTANYGSGDIPYCQVYNLPREWTESVEPPTVPQYYWFEANEDQFVYCRWLMRESKYYVIGVPNNLSVMGDDPSLAPGPTVHTYPQTMHLTFDIADFNVVDDGDGHLTVSLK